MPGFKKFVRQGLTLQVAQTLRIDVTLDVGSVTESVTVSEATPLLKTESGELSHTVTRTHGQLPLLSIGPAAGTRAFGTHGLVALLPGSFLAAGANGTNSRSHNGAPPTRKSWWKARTGPTHRPGPGQQNQPGADSIQEWTIQTSNYAAEFGQAGGAIMNVTMKSGTNAFHGSAYEYFQEDFNAAQPFTVSGKPERAASGRRYAAEATMA